MSLSLVLKCLTWDQKKAINAGQLAIPFRIPLQLRKDQQPEFSALVLSSW
jgi:hypothetical protein